MKNNKFGVRKRTASYTNTHIKREEEREESGETERERGKTYIAFRLTQNHLNWGKKSCLSLLSKFLRGNNDLKIFGTVA